MRSGRALLALLSVVAIAACADAPRGPGGVTVESRPDAIRIASPTSVVIVTRSPYRLAFEARDGTPLAAESTGVFWERGGNEGPLGGNEEQLGDVVAERVLADGVALTVAAGAAGEARVTVRFVRDRSAEVVIEPPAPESVAALGDRWQSPPDERIYGLTERLRDAPALAPGTVDIPREDLIPVETGGLDRRGERVAMVVTPTFAVYGPFFHSSRGYGLAVSGTTAGWFDVARDDPGQIAFRFETGNAPESRVLRFHLFHGGHAQVLDEYTALTGRPFVPPDWAFLHWRWRGELTVGEPVAVDGTPINRDVADDVLMYEALGIPPGVYLFDRPVLAGEYGFARWAWDAQRLPNVPQMLAALGRRGYRLVMWSSLWTCGSAPGDNGSDALALGFLAPGGSGPPRCDDVLGNNFILDPTSAAARDWWRERVRDFFRDNGIRGVKLDRGEEHIPSQATDVWADGRTGREVRNDYPTLQAKIHFDAMNEAFPGDSLVFTRSAYTGTQQWAVVWGGDIPGSERFGTGPGTDLGLRSAIISQQRAAFLGYPIWGSDTGGYYEFKDREVFARWIEFSAFSGIMEIGGIGDHAPWRMPTEPAYDEELIAIYRRYAVFRERLQPYLVTAARDAGASGLPLVRPLVFAFPDDPAVGDLWDEYLLGPDLLVAPVWRTGERARAVYLPAGSWRSLWDASQRFAGPVSLTVDAPLDTIPVFVRGDAPAP